MPEVTIRPRDTFEEQALARLRTWLEVAYADPPGSWRAEHWDDLGPGPHLTIEDDHGLAAHACIAWVDVLAGDRRLRAGYLEDVATRADRRGEGLGTAVVAAAAPLLEADAELGLLATGSLAFYERLGWVPWTGQLSVSEADGTITPTHEEEGYVMALFLPRTPPWVRVDLPLRRPRRDPEEAW
jgi:aminoglycoside 2'-N-acetyltransferase I